MKTPPKTQIDTMQADQFFVYAPQLLKLHPPHLTDQPIIAQIEADRLRAGQKLRYNQGRSCGEEGVGSCPCGCSEPDGMESANPRPGKRVVNYWSMNTDTMGVYGNYYLKRAIVCARS